MARQAASRRGEKQGGKTENGNDAGAGEAPSDAAPLGRALLTVPCALFASLVALMLFQVGVHDFIYHDDSPAWLTPRSSDEIKPGAMLPPHAHLFDNESDGDDD